METLSVLIYALLVAILSLGIWQIVLFKRHSKTSIKSTQLNDSKYFELKAQLQYLKSVFPVILLILLYAGYRQLDTLPTIIKNDITEKVSHQIDSLRDSTKALILEQKRIGEKYRYLDDFYQSLQGKGVTISKGLGNSNAALSLLEQNLKALQNQTNTISNKDIVNQPIYVVSDLTYEMKGGTWQSFKFSDCKTISGNKLPEFNKPPLILSFSNYGGKVLICSVTNKQFMGTHDSSYDGPDCKTIINDKLKFSLIIFEQK